MFGKRWRTKQELWYITKHQLNQSLSTFVIGIWTGFIIVASIYVNQTWGEDFPNWYAAVLSIYLGILVAIIAYLKAKKSQEDIEIKVKRIEGMLFSSLDLEKNHPKTSQFYLSLALNGIIDTFPEIEKLSKKWKKAKKHEQKKFLEEKLNYYWKNSITSYGLVLDNPDYILDKLYDNEILDSLKDIYKKCKIFPSFDYDKNKISFHYFHRCVVDCILILDKLKIDSKFETDLFRY